MYYPHVVIDTHGLPASPQNRNQLSLTRIPEERYEVNKTSPDEPSRAIHSQGKAMRIWSTTIMVPSPQLNPNGPVNTNEARLQDGYHLLDAIFFSRQFHRVGTTGFEVDPSTQQPFCPRGTSASAPPLDYPDFSHYLVCATRPRRRCPCCDVRRQPL